MKMRNYARKQDMVVRLRNKQNAPCVLIVTFQSESKDGYKISRCRNRPKGQWCGRKRGLGGSDVDLAPQTSNSSEATGCIRSSRTSRTTLGEPHPSLSLSLASPLSLYGAIAPMDLWSPAKLIVSPGHSTWPSANRGDTAVPCTAVFSRLNSRIHLGGRALLPGKMMTFPTFSIKYPERILSFPGYDFCLLG